MKLGVGIGIAKGGRQGFIPSETIAILGDSITNQNTTYTDSGNLSFWANGPWVWAGVAMNQRFALARRGTTDFDFGYSGKRADEILTYVPDVIASGADTCAEMSGTNDIAQSASASTIVTRRQALWAALRAGGMRVIACEIPPVVNGTLMAATTLANAALKTAAAESGIRWIEWPTTLLSAGVADSNYFPDGTHPNELGAKIMGDHLASALDSIVQPTDYAMPASGAASWITPNPYVTGTGGTKGTGTTGQLADSWTTSLESNISAVASKVGDWQQIAATGTGYAKSIIYAQNMTVGSGWNIGDTVRGVLEIESDAAGWDMKGLYAHARFHSAGTGGASPGDGSSSIAAMAAPLSTIGGTILTPPAVIPSGTTRVQIYLVFFGRGTFRFRGGVFKV